MKFINNAPWRNLVTALMLPLLLAGGLVLGGCNNDAVAPHDEAPALTAGDVAGQAGFVAMATGIVGPQTVEFTAKSDKNSYSHVFAGGNVAGTIFLDFFTGGAGGTSATPDVADYVNLYTADGAPLILTVGLEGLEGTIALGFDIAADLDRDANPDTATITGGGTFASGPYTADFTFGGVVVASGASYPSAGTLSLTGSGFTMTVTFNGTNMANMVDGDGALYRINLDTGEVTALGVPM